MLVPLVVPEIVAGISALLIFSQLGIQLSLLDVVIAHITFSISYVTIVVRARLASISQEVEEAAMDLGATRFGAVRLALVPALWPSILAAGLLVFAFSFDDFVLSFFTTRRGPAAAAGADLVGDPLRALADDQRDRDADDGRLADRDRARDPPPAPLRPSRERPQGADRERGLGKDLSDGRGDPDRGREQALRLQLAVDDVTLDIHQGEFFSLLGPSGCGKTTTLRMLAGFEVPTEGRILLDGEPVDDVPPYQRDVNMVFQSYALFEHLDVEDNVAFGLRAQEGRQGRDRAPGRRRPRAGRPRGARQRADERALRAASASASPSRGRSSTGRRCCCSTSRSAPST